MCSKQLNYKLQTVTNTTDEDASFKHHPHVKHQEWLLFDMSVFTVILVSMSLLHQFEEQREITEEALTFTNSESYFMHVTVKNEG